MKRKILFVIFLIALIPGICFGEIIDFNYTVDMSWKDYKKIDITFEASADSSGYPCYDHSKTDERKIFIPYKQEVTLERTIKTGDHRRCKNTDRSTQYRQNINDSWISFTSTQNLYHSGDLYLKLYAESNADKNILCFDCYRKCSVVIKASYYDITPTTDQTQSFESQSASIITESVKTEIGRLAKPKSQFDGSNDSIPNGVVRDFETVAATNNPNVVVWCEEHEDEFIIYASPKSENAMHFNYNVDMSWKDYKKVDKTFETSADSSGYPCYDHSKTNERKIFIPYEQEVTLERTIKTGDHRRCKNTAKSTQYRKSASDTWTTFTSTQNLYHAGDLYLKLYAESNADKNILCFDCYRKCSVVIKASYYDETPDTNQLQNIKPQFNVISTEPIKTEIIKIPKPETQFDNGNEYIPGGIVREFNAVAASDNPDVLTWCEENEDEFIIYAFPKAALSKEIAPFASIAMIKSSGKKVENISGQPMEVVKIVKYKDDEFQLEHDITEFIGQAYDVDGNVTEYKWESDRDGFLSDQKSFFTTGLSMGRHKISFQARDDDNLWSTVSTRIVDVIKPPTLMVHGFMGNGDNWIVGDNAMGMIADKYPVKTIDIEPNNAQFSKGAGKVSEEVKKLTEEIGVPKVNIVAHSMGGLNSRWYIQNNGYRNDVNKLVMLGTPNHGSTLAIMLRPDKAGDHEVIYNNIRDLVSMIPYVGGLLKDGLKVIADTGYLWGPAVIDLIPGSSALKALNKNKKDEGFTGNEPADNTKTVFGNRVQYFNIYGEGMFSLSHWHLEIPWIGLYYYDFILPAITFDSDFVVTKQSARLDDVPSAGMRGIWHCDLNKNKKAINKAIYFLGDDPPETDSAEIKIDAGTVLAGQVIYSTNADEGLPTITPGSAVNIPFVVDKETDKIHIMMLSSPSETETSLSIELISPTGDMIDMNSQSVRYEENPGTVTISIMDVKPGSWTAKINAAGGDTAAHYGLMVFGETNFWIALSEHEKIEPGQPLNIRAYVQKAGSPFTGLNVTATLSKSLDKGDKIGSKYGAEFTDMEPEEIILSDLGGGLYEAVYSNTLSSGLYSLVITAADSETGISRTAFTTYFVEYEYDLEIESPIQFSNNSPMHGDMIELSASIRNNSGVAAKGVEVMFTDGDIQNGGRVIGTEQIDIEANSTGNISTSWKALAGEHEIFIIASPMNSFIEADMENNVARTMIQVGNLPPTAKAGRDITASFNMDTQSNGNIFLDASGSDDDVEIVKYIWDINTGFDSDGDGNLENDADLEGINTVIPGGTYKKVGDYEVRLIVFDGSNQSDSDTIKISVRQIYDFESPLANAGSDLTAIVNEPIRFNGSASSDNLGIASYIWDINTDFDSNGDGILDNDIDMTGSQPVLTTGYAELGIYKVKLTVSDAAGNETNSDTMTVTVQRPDNEIYGVMGYTLTVDGHPMPNVTIQLNGETYIYSDDNGYYLIDEGLSEGVYTVSAVVDGKDFESDSIQVSLNKESPIMRFDFREAVPSKITGDIDGDGDVDRDDTTIIQSHLNKPASVCPECDLDGDGTITILDARKIVQLCTCSRCLCP
ncbi:Alpha/beta hydrolase of unknown function, DUF915 [Desulfonema limicola]|uniref:PKD domain-containing protein n=1 Tax=Desulfonema limicola TaxID=45656 RepID=A0A975BAK0_9BACT|nr:alpha/beta fold hydrolase [Desulfonema limicola]QTA81798.1 Alpha/beta hydrolase of unknown function, DUF915 [Desulfonema limicola]